MFQGSDEVWKPLLYDSGGAILFAMTCLYSQGSLTLMAGYNYSSHLGCLGNSADLLEVKGACNQVWPGKRSSRSEVRAGSNNFAEYKPKYFSRHEKSAKNTYFRKRVSD